MRRMIGLLALLAPIAACGGEGETQAAEPARNITVFELSESTPELGSVVPGVVEPYRQSEVGLDVGGRLTFVEDIGRELLGPLLDDQDQPILDANGAPIREGDVIATLDDTRYVQALRSVELKEQSAQLQLEALQIDLERIASADVASARAQAEAAASQVDIGREDVVASLAERDLASSTLERNRPLVESGAVAQLTLEQNIASLQGAEAQLERARSAVTALQQAKDAADALVAKAEGSVLYKQAQIEAARAQLAELGNEFERAQLDLDSCVLRAPFSGRVVATHSQPGSWVSSGSPVVTLVLMAPMRVAITASAELERAFEPGMGVRVHPVYGTPELVDSGLIGTVYEKGQVADPATRTFRIGIMTRNPLSNADAQGRRRPVADIFPVISMTADDSGPLWINADCIVEEGGQSYVLKLPSLQLRSVERDLDARLSPTRVNVQLSDDWERIDRWTMRRLAEQGELSAGDALLVHPDQLDTQEVSLNSSQWTLRPGDIVRVALEVGRPPSGLWVPVTAIRELNGATFAMRVRDDRLEQVQVTLGEAAGELRRVVDGSLAAGDRILARGLAFAVAGELVNVKGTTDLR